MKKVLTTKALLLTTLALIFFQTLQAKHIIGGELYYECLGFTNGDSGSNSRSYQIFMRLYRDAVGGGADFDSAPVSQISATVSVYRSNGDLLFTDILSQPQETPFDLEAPGICVPLNFGLEEGLYTFPVYDLPIINESYFIVYQRCCRDETLVNIADSGISGATYFVEITPEAQAQCNSSPVFNTFPQFVICANDPFQFDASASDVDGNRLEYSLCAPLLGAGTLTDASATSFNGIAPNPDAPPPYDDLVYVSSEFNAQNPFGSMSTFQIDANTGVISGIPAVTGRFAVGVCVREFASDGTLIGEVRRDFQILVNNCDRDYTFSLDNLSPASDGTISLQYCELGQVFIENTSTFNSELVESEWTFSGNGLSQTFMDLNPRPDISLPGVYNGEFKFQLANGCRDSFQTIINAFLAPMAGFAFTPQNPTTETPEISFNDLSMGANSWNWDFGGQGSATEQNPVFTFGLDNLTIPVTQIVNSPEGCADTLTRNVLFAALGDFSLPNAFSPNNDGVNDDFRGFVPTSDKTEFEMAVFDRWGGRVFFSRDPNLGWNGLRNNSGEPLPIGVYVYYVTFKDRAGDLITLRGLVNLLK